jgi:hypothetical protein
MPAKRISKRAPKNCPSKLVFREKLIFIFFGVTPKNMKINFSFLLQQSVAIVVELRKIQTELDM